MKILHTSDWHLGRTLYEKRRVEEHTQFLEWLLLEIETHHIDLLLICGDIFDSVTPSNTSLQLYFTFVANAVKKGCRHIVVIGGNHDSPSLLEASKVMMHTLGAHVIGATNDVEEEVLLLKDEKGEAEAIVCAVPFLRDRDVRVSYAQEHYSDKQKRLLEGIENHYSRSGEIALQIKKRENKPLPIILTGHLFTQGSHSYEGDGVRDLYVGTALHLPPSIFLKEASYVALGHLHQSQQVGSHQHIRYSGTPIPIGFSEAASPKEVIVIELNQERVTQITPVQVPLFQTLVTLSGDEQQLTKELSELVEHKKPIWVEVHYEGNLGPATLKKHLFDAIENSQVEILAIKSEAPSLASLKESGWNKTLDQIDEKEVFRRRLELNEFTEEEKERLTLLYEEVLHSLSEEESQ